MPSPGSPPPSSPDMGSERLQAEHAVQPRRRQFLRTGRDCVASNASWASHRRPEPRARRTFPVSDRPLHDVPVHRAEEFLDAALDLVVGKWIGAVEPGEDFQGVLLPVEVHQHQVEVLGHPQLLHLDPVAVVGHQDGAVAEGTPLVHPSTARGGGDLPLVGEFHLPAVVIFRS